MKENKKDILWRVYLVYGGMVFFGFAIVFKVAHLQISQGAYYRAKADSLTTRIVAIPPSRGNIYTADGGLLATSVPVYEVRFDTRAPAITGEVFRRNIDSLALGLSHLFPQEAAAATQQKWLHECALYATLEPCPICAGAMLLARIPQLYFGAFDAKAGAAGTLFCLTADPRLNHQVETWGGICANQSIALLQQFFREQRGTA